MSYEYDVFISYRRQKLWTPWVRDCLKDLIESYLQEELGERPRIFVDERIEVGADWIDSLAEALAKSKVVLSVFSKDYFSSQWCIHELDLITERSSIAAGGSGDKCRLIVPTVVHDGEVIPVDIKRLQPYDLKKFRVPHLCKGSHLSQEFCIAIQQLAPQIRSAVESAPDFDENWVAHHKKRLNEVYEAIETGKTIAPTKFDLVDAKPLTIPPRHMGA